MTYIVTIRSCAVVVKLTYKGGKFQKIEHFKENGEIEISKNEFNNKFSKLLEDKDFLKKQLNKTMSEDEFPKLFNSILNNSIFK